MKRGSNDREEFKGKEKRKELENEGLGDNGERRRTKENKVNEENWTKENFKLKLGCYMFK